MPKKKPTKTEARPKKKKAERSPVSKGVASARAAAPRRGTRETAPRAVASRSAATKASPKVSADARTRSAAEEKVLKPLAKVKAGARETAPAAAAKAPQKPAKPARRIPSGELNKIRTLLSQKKIALTNHLQSELSELEKPEKRHRTDLEEIASDTHDTDSLCEQNGQSTQEWTSLQRATAIGAQLGLNQVVCQGGTAASLAEAMSNHGPLWTPVPGNEYHVIVLAGVTANEGNPQVHVLDPTTGADSWLPMADLAAQYGISDAFRGEVLAPS